MALDKTPININFSQGLDTKTDPNQVPIGKFLALSNSVFDKAGRLTKRNGFTNITSLPNEVQTTLTTLNDNLIATGTNLYAYSEGLNEWFNKGSIQPVSLSVQPIYRSSTNQTSPDVAFAPDNDLICTTFLDNGQGYYVVSDSITGEQLFLPVELPTTATACRAFTLGRYFIVTYLATVGGQPHLQFVAIPISNPTNPLAAADFSTVNPTSSSLSAGYDGIVANNNLYISWSDSSGMKFASISSSLNRTFVSTPSTHTATCVSVVADTTSTTPVIWTTYYDNTSTVRVYAFDSQLNVILAETTAIGATSDIVEVTSLAQNGLLTIIIEQDLDYASPYPFSTRTDLLSKAAINQSGTVTESLTTLVRSVGLASKAFFGPNDTIYFLSAFGSTNQPSYFLMDITGKIYMRLAYSNGGGYEATQVLPSVTLSNSQYYTVYLYKDFLASTNKQTNSGLPTEAIYTQTGVNLATFSINDIGQYSSEIAGALHLTGGQLWEYDGSRPVEFGFQVWPEDVVVTTTTTGSSQTFFYQVAYEWTDNQGNLHRSAPSIPFEIQTASGTPNNTVYVPTLRITDKLVPNPVRIVIYRWSVAQQVYYQITSITSPIINDPTIDFVSYNDTATDAAILGNTILYTTGGVVEDIAPPACVASTLFKNRLLLIDAEDRNLIWYSKQVIENTPVEMSDLFTLYVSPTTGSQGSTGPLTALSAMDDKLIMFKKDAIYYLTGTGPDNTGANNDFTDPIFITASVGCANPNSIALTPMGLMFQSDKGIWQLGRDLSTTYVGAAVEQYNTQTVLSSQVIPATNQVRFILPNGITLMYDYFYQQWGTFTNINAISGTLYQSLHTYLNTEGEVFQENIGSYIDGSRPVLMSFTTAWISLAGLQGYERFYAANLLGTYFSPFKLNVALAYDYNPYASQNILVTPDNYSPPWGGDASWGSNANWGGSSNVFSARIFPQQQKCETVQISIQESFDPTVGPTPGQGLAMSGLLALVGVKRGSRTQKASRSFG